MNDKSNTNTATTNETAEPRNEAAISRLKLDRATVTVFRVSSNLKAGFIVAPECAFDSGGPPPTCLITIKHK